MHWKDTPSGYGLVSILAHWLGAAAIIAMLVTGNFISDSRDSASMRIHTGIAIATYMLLMFRVYWRLRHSHPDALSEQSPRLLALAKVVHYVMIGLIAIMLVSGPVLAWAGNLPLSFFGLFELPLPETQGPDAFGTFHRIHVLGAGALLALILGHIGVALVHMVFFKDRTLDKILIPAADQLDSTPDQSVD